MIVVAVGLVLAIWFVYKTRANAQSEAAAKSAAMNSGVVRLFNLGKMEATKRFQQAVADMAAKNKKK